MKRNPAVVQIVISYLTFNTLGLAVGLRGVAWPSIRVTFGLPLDAVGALLIAATVGSVFSSFNGGLIASLIGIGRLLVISSLVTGLGLLGYALTPAWWVMVMTGLSSGLGSGATHVGLNAYFASHHSAGAMNWLHACFGLGATLGPLIMTAMLSAGLSWRWGYGAIGAWMCLLSLCFGLTVDRWRGSSGGANNVMEQDSVKKGSLDPLTLPVVWISLLLFFAYTGIESTAGQWVYSLFTEARSVSESRAGLWVSVYWGGLTGGRVLLGAVADRLDVPSLVRVCVLCVLGGAVLVWWDPTVLLSFFGLGVMGLAEGPIFPTLVSNLPRLVGSDQADNVIGFQVAAASLGAALVSSLAGVLAERTTLEIIGPFLVFFALIMLVLYEMILRWERYVDPSA